MSSDYFNKIIIKLFKTARKKTITIIKKKFWEELIAAFLSLKMEYFMRQVGQNFIIYA
jgi:hypothetical protein